MLEQEREDVGGRAMYALAEELFPIFRSLTGEGVRKTLSRIEDIIPIQVHSVASGEQVFDWIVPDEWSVREAWIKDSDGNKVIDICRSNLHLVGYSKPVNEVLDLAELRAHLYSLPEQPDAIPYITSYYRETWGFCLTDRQLKDLQPGEYHVYVDSALKPGVLNYADLVIPGKSEEEVMLSTYICHPSMANNELSGPVLATFLAKWLMREPRKYTYRIVFVPETIGSICYLSRNFQSLKEQVIAGYILTCCGDERTYSFLESREGNTLADRAALAVLREVAPDFKFYSYLERGSDERQYCAPGVDLPVASVMRSKYGEYPEYHTSLDNMDLISPEGFSGAFVAYQRIINLLEANGVYKVTCMCEPQLGKRGLYPNTSTRDSTIQVQAMMNVLAYADGTRDLIEISEKINVSISQVLGIAKRFIDEGLLAEASVTKSG